jgi:FtsH-binding integral membrane protein
MSMFPNPTGYRKPVGLEYSTEQSSALSRFMNAVYAWMCVGLALTAAVAYYVSHNAAVMKPIFSSGVFIILLIAELGLVVVISRAVNKINAVTATVLFLLYAGMNGLTLSAIFLIYSLPTIGAAFAVTAGMFGTMSVIGFVMKTDLTRYSSYFMMALVGIIIASVVNLFWANSILYWGVTYLGVLLFVGLTAYDTQRLKFMARQLEGNEAMSARMSIVGSLVLYLDFINLFLFILRILGRRSS